MHRRLVKVFAALTDRDSDIEADRKALEELQKCVEDIQKHSGKL
jgi:hypothetical protein